MRLSPSQNSLRLWTELGPAQCANPESVGCNCAVVIPATPRCRKPTINNFFDETKPAYGRLHQKKEAQMLGTCICLINLFAQVSWLYHPLEKRITGKIYPSLLQLLLTKPYSIQFNRTRHSMWQYTSTIFPHIKINIKRTNLFINTKNMFY